MKIYTAQIDTPFGLFKIAVDSIEQYARTDMYNAATSEFSAPIGMLRIKGKIKKSNRRILARMIPVKHTTWAWVSKCQN